MSETQFPFVPPPPPVWRDPRARAEIFDHPLGVQVNISGVWTSSAPALAAISKPWQPGRQKDQSSVSGLIRLTLPRPGLYVFVGRARGTLSALRVERAAVQARWLGLDSVPTGSLIAPKGWHPFVLELQCLASSTWNLNGLKISALSGRFAE